MATVPFRTILVPFDFSPHSERALDVAIAFARALGARIELLHAMELPSEARSLYGVVFAESILDRVRAAAASRLEAPLGRVRVAGVPVRAHLRLSAAAQAIQDVAAEVGADLIVMGTRGRGGAVRALLGSVAAHTLRTAPCAVLTVAAETPAARETRPR